MFDLDAHNLVRNVKGAILENYLKYHFPYFEVINSVFEKVMDTPFSNLE